MILTTVDLVELMKARLNFERQSVRYLDIK